MKEVPLTLKCTCLFTEMPHLSKNKVQELSF
jgi:hypothetical protein